MAGSRLEVDLADLSRGSSRVDTVAAIQNRIENRIVYRAGQVAQVQVESAVITVAPRHVGVEGTHAAFTDHDIDVRRVSSTPAVHQEVEIAIDLAAIVDLHRIGAAIPTQVEAERGIAEEVDAVGIVAVGVEIGGGGERVHALAARDVHQGGGVTRQVAQELGRDRVLARGGHQAELGVHELREITVHRVAADARIDIQLQTAPDDLQVQGLGVDQIEADLIVAGPC